MVGAFSWVCLAFHSDELKGEMLKTAKREFHGCTADHSGGYALQKRHVSHILDSRHWHVK